MNEKVPEMDETLEVHPWCFRHGSWFSYSQTPRAKIMAREQGGVTDEASMIKLMRSVLSAGSVTGIWIYPGTTTSSTTPWPWCQAVTNLSLLPALLTGL